MLSICLYGAEKVRSDLLVLCTRSILIHLAQCVQSVGVKHWLCLAVFTSFTFSNSSSSFSGVWCFSSVRQATLRKHQCARRAGEQQHQYGLDTHGAQCNNLSGQYQYNKGESANSLAPSGSVSMFVFSSALQSFTLTSYGASEVGSIISSPDWRG